MQQSVEIGRFVQIPQTAVDKLLPIRCNEKDLIYSLFTHAEMDRHAQKSFVLARNGIVDGNLYQRRVPLRISDKRLELRFIDGWDGRLGCAHQLSLAYQCEDSSKQKGSQHLGPTSSVGHFAPPPVLGIV